MNRIVIVGSSNIDLTMRTGRIPSKGETVIGKDMRMCFGGKGANQAVAACRLGGDVKFITKLGKDAYGKMMSDNLVKEGLDAGGIIIDEERPSGTAWICVDDCGDNTIVVMSGANGAMTPSDIEPFAESIRAAEYVLLQLEIPLETVAHVVDLAFEGGAKVILNPAPAQMIPDSVLSKTWLVVPNEKECSLLCGKNSCESPAENAAFLLSRGVGNVIVTLGENGSLLCNRECTVSVPAQKIEAVDTVAAGDTYCGALCVGVSEGMTLPEAMAFATKASGISVTRHGAQSSVPYRHEIE